MKQVSDKEKKFLENIGLVPLLLYVCAEDLSTFKWGHFTSKWSEENYYKTLIVREKKNIFLFKSQENISYIFLLTASDKQEYLPSEIEIENLISTLDIKSLLVWRNEFLFNTKEEKKFIIDLITDYTLLGGHIVLIQKKLNDLGYSKEEIQNILSMHPIYANTDLLVCTYPERLNFLDRNKLRSFDDVKLNWIESKKIKKSKEVYHE